MHDHSFFKKKKLLSNNKWFHFNLHLLRNLIPFTNKKLPAKFKQIKCKESIINDIKVTRMAFYYKFICILYIHLSVLKICTYLMDSGWTFDIESLSMSLITNSFLKKNSVPLDTLTGMRIRSARIVIGTKIFKLPGEQQEISRMNVHLYWILYSGSLGWCYKSKPAKWSFSIGT